MSTFHKLRYRIVEAPNSLGAKSRARRSQLFIALFPNLSEMSVIDLGGTLESWRRAPVRPAHVHVVNLEAADGPVPEWADFDYGDACDLPTSIRGNRYDLVFSNSVLEHVGGHEQRRQFADTVHALAPRHWVQTPYRYFPIEPHWLFPGFQFLPLSAKAAVAQHWPLAHSQATDHSAALRVALGVELVGRTEMRYLFPLSELYNERVLGVTKSLVAFKTS
jgi:hypothetical protein